MITKFTNTNGPMTKTYTQEPDGTITKTGRLTLSSGSYDVLDVSSLAGLKEVVDGFGT